MDSLKTVFAARRRAVASSMQDGSLALFLAGEARQKTWDQDFPFSVDRNFFYLTGLERAGDILALEKRDGKLTERLFISRPTAHQQLYYGHMPTCEEMAEECGIETVLYHDRFDWEMGRLLARNPFNVLYMDFAQRELDGPPDAVNLLCRRLCGAHPYLRAENLAGAVAALRRIKTEDEIKAIREAIRLTGLGINGILRELAPGVSERRLQARFEYEVMCGGGAGNAFNPIIAGGKNSVVLHYENNDQLLADGDLLLVDLGAEYGWYSADISRTFPANGRFTQQQRFFYDTVLLGQQAVQQALRPGLEIDKTLDIARGAMYPNCKEAGVAATEDDMKKLLPHGVCHYLGLDTHDVGARDTLQPGMVITIEPGLYLPELGFGIRIEDDALITAEGCEILSANIPKKAEEIEALMAERDRGAL